MFPQVRGHSLQPSSDLRILTTSPGTHWSLPPEDSRPHHAKKISNRNKHRTGDHLQWLTNVEQFGQQARPEDRPVKVAYPYTPSHPRPCRLGAVMGRTGKDRTTRTN